MNPAWWGIPVVVIIGAVVVWYGWWSDRHATREAIEASQRPVRDVPQRHRLHNHNRAAQPVAAARASGCQLRRRMLNDIE